MGLACCRSQKIRSLGSKVTSILERSDSPPEKKKVFNDLYMKYPWEKLRARSGIYKE